MAHFSRGTQEFKKEIQANKPYRVTAWINLRTNWNDSLGKYEEMTEQQKADCEKLYDYMREYGAQISVSFHERTGSDNVKDFPLAGRTTVYVNKQKPEQQPSDQAVADKYVATQINTGF